jgi:DNA-binding PadR family transcriptional regulator
MPSPQDLLPLRSIDFLILLMLAPKERHGYGIMQDVLDDERRRYYRLTPFGRKVVTAEAARLRALVRLAEAARLIDPLPRGARA